MDAASDHSFDLLFCVGVAGEVFGDGLSPPRTLGVLTALAGPQEADDGGSCRKVARHTPRKVALANTGCVQTLPRRALVWNLFGTFGQSSGICYTTSELARFRWRGIFRQLPGNRIISASIGFSGAAAVTTRNTCFRLVSPILRGPRDLTVRYFRRYDPVGQIVTSAGGELVAACGGERHHHMKWLRVINTSTGHQVHYGVAGRLARGHTRKTANEGRVNKLG